MSDASLNPPPLTLARALAQFAEIDYVDLNFQLYDADLEDIAALSPSNGQFLVHRAGAWAADGILSADLTTALTTPPAIGGTTPNTARVARLTLGEATFPGSGTILLNASQTANSGRAILQASTANASVGFAQIIAINDSGASITLASYGSTFGSGLSDRSAVFASKTLVLGSNTSAASGGTLPIIFSPGGFDASVAGKAYLLADGKFGIGNLLSAPTTRLHVIESDAATNTVVNVATLGKNSSGTPAASFGGGLALQLESSTTENVDAARIRWLWTTATHASRVSNAIFSLVNSGSEVDVLTLTPTGVSALPDTNATSTFGRTVLYSFGSDQATFAHFDHANGTNYALRQNANGATLLNAASGQVVAIGVNDSTSVQITGAGLTMINARDITFGTTTGTKIGTGATQKLGFWNAVPIIQPSHINDPSGGATTDAEARTAINAILDLLQAAGLMAA